MITSTYPGYGRMANVDAAMDDGLAGLAGLGGVDILSAVGGAGVAIPLLVGGLILAEAIFSKRSTEKRNALRKAREDYNQRVAEIKGTYSRRATYGGSRA